MISLNINYVFNSYATKQTKVVLFWKEEKTFYKDTAYGWQSWNHHSQNRIWERQKAWLWHL